MEKFSFDTVRRRFVVRVVTNDELENASFMRDVRNFNARLKISRFKIRDYLANGVEESEAYLVDEAGNRCYPTLEIIEKEDLDDDDRDGFEWWYKDWSKPVPPGITPRIRLESRERVRLLVTVLRMMFPKESSVWGAQPLMVVLPQQALP